MIRPEDQILVIFGASGDLAKRKLLPALYALEQSRLLPEGFAVLGTGRTSYDDDSYRRYVSEMLKQHDDSSQEKINSFINRINYHTMDPSDEGEYEGLKNKLIEITSKYQLPENFIFYLATPPSLYDKIPCYLKNCGLTREDKNKWRRVIIEKPFGLDLDSAAALNQSLHSFLKEHQIYRIDHYLGKETVQNILVTRFSNGIFEPLWNRNYIDHVEITSAETIGIGDRGGYYEHAGALRDMLQNHLFQLVAFVGMEPPTVISSEAIRNEILKVLQSFRPIPYEEVNKFVVRGQYMRSSIKGESLQSYREEGAVDDESKTETYVAMKLFIDNWRWGGVPFYIRTGKRLPMKVTEIVIHFKPSPHTLFCFGNNGYKSNNQLVIRIQPDEGIQLRFGMKVQGAGYNVQDTSMDFYYRDLTDNSMPEAYQRLLLDAMQGDPTLYARGDVVEQAWRFVDPILRRWKEDSSFPLFGYSSGSWGPFKANDLIEGEKDQWHYPCENLTEESKSITL